MKHTYDPQVTAEKGAMEGTSAAAFAGVIAMVFGIEPEQAVQIAGAIGGAVAIWKMARNWWKNRKAAV
jgi:membrane associated rhomboid family serine protease